MLTHCCHLQAALRLTEKSKDSVRADNVLAENISFGFETLPPAIPPLIGSHY
jgi:hypothetical protein